jgi:hypothetical protein
MPVMPVNALQAARIESTGGKCAAANRAAGHSIKHRPEGKST